MSDFIVGFTIGISIGSALGIAIEISLRQQKKPWSTLTEDEIKVRKNTLLVGTMILIIGIIAFLIALLTKHY